MSQDPLKKIFDLIQKLFVVTFTRYDQRQERLANLTIVNWKSLAHPLFHHNDTLTVFDYNNNIVRDSLFCIKNKKDTYTLTHMCQILVDILLEDLADKRLLENFTDPILVSIPSSKQHILRRGYNPSDIIAREISTLSSLPYKEHILTKIKHTPDQKTLSRYKRLINVKNSMNVDRKQAHKIKNRCVVVIDDIMTTGSTFKEAKRTLLKSGAKKVIGVMLAH